MSVVRNPVLMLAWGLPAVAVLASFASLILTLRSPESELPEQYHWEGFQLDRDFSQAARATELKVHATLAGFDATHRCELTLRVAGAAPESLELLVAHSTQPQLDQRVKFARIGDGAASASAAQASGAARAQEGARSPDGAHDQRSAARYWAICGPAPDSHWRIELVDAKGGWAVRQTLRGPLDGASLDAVSGTNE